MPRKKGKAKPQPSWRPDFRNQDTLPDIKVVRTGFLLNLVMVSLVAILLGVLAYREYRIASLGGAVASLRADIASNAATDRASVRMSQAFQRAVQSTDELGKFLNVPVTPDDLVYTVASLQPPEVVLDSISLTPSVVRQGRRETVYYELVVNGTVADSPNLSATEIVTAYRNAYGQAKLLEPYFQSSELSNFRRNDALGLFNFTVRVTLTLEPQQQ